MIYSFVALFQVIIHKDQIVLFDFKGKPMASKHKALSAACAEIYQYLTSTFPNSGTYNILACVILKAFDYFVLYLRVESKDFDKMFPRELI